MTWNLRDLLPEIDSREYKQLLSELEKNIKFIESYKPKLKPNILNNDFMKIIKSQEKIAEIKSRLGRYAYLWFSEDTSNQKAKAFMSKIEHLNVDASNRTMFFSLWFKKLDKKNANRLIKNVDKDYKYLLRTIRKLSKYTLSEAEEKVINLKDISGESALDKIYSIITNNFTYELIIKNKKKILTREELTSYVKNPDAKIRKDAYQSLYKVYEKNKDVLNEIYRSLVLDWKNEGITLRKHKSPISIRNLSNDASDKSIDAMLNVCIKNKKVFQNYFKLKSKLCKIKNMQRYDLYSPYSSKEKKYYYEKAKKMVFKAYKNYSEEMFNLAKNIFDNAHIHYKIKKGKVGGAYCMNVPPNCLPYVLLNYDNELRDVFTMAHEIGHAVHDQLAHNHSILVSSPPLILAETASVFGEMLLFEDIIKEIKNKKIKKSLLISKLDDIYATVIRQTYFVLFEIEAHNLISEGADLHDLEKVYLKNLKEQFGNSLIVNNEFKYEWLSIPHIYSSPFYCYAYAFGNLLVLSLYKKYKIEGKSFIPKYLKILSYGGSENPGKILKEVGIDIEDEKFWQSGFDLIKNMIKELEELK